MRIPCPYCGDRDLAEFVCRGEARAPGADLYLRDNPAGPASEHWHHAYGCRRWLVVERDTRTHTVFSAALAQGDRT